MKHSSTFTVYIQTYPLGIAQLQHFYRDIIKCIIISSIFLWFNSEAQSEGMLKNGCNLLFLIKLCNFKAMNMTTNFVQTPLSLVIYSKKYMLQKSQS